MEMNKRESYSIPNEKSHRKSQEKATSGRLLQFQGERRKRKRSKTAALRGFEVVANGGEPIYSCNHKWMSRQYNCPRCGVRVAHTRPFL
jgi:hypothetical protein